MTPELQTQLFGWLITALVSVGSITYALGRYFIKRLNVQLTQNKEDREQEREKIQAKIDEQKREFDLRYAEFEAGREIQNRLFELNDAHAKSYNIIASVIDRLESNATSAINSNTERIGDVAGKIDVVYQGQTSLSINMNELSGVVNNASKKVDDLITRIGNFFEDLTDRDESITNSTTQSRHEILEEVRGMKRDMDTLKTVQHELGIIKEYMKKLHDTRPLPALDDDGNPVSATPDAKASDSNENDNPKKKDIA